MKTNYKVYNRFHYCLSHLMSLNLLHYPINWVIRDFMENSFPSKKKKIKKLALLNSKCFMGCMLVTNQSEITFS